MCARVSQWIPTLVKPVYCGFEPYFDIFSLFAVATVQHINTRQQQAQTYDFVDVWLVVALRVCVWFSFWSPKSYGSGIENKYKISRSRRHHHRSSVGRVFACIRCEEKFCVPTKVKKKFEPHYELKKEKKRVRKENKYLWKKIKIQREIWEWISIKSVCIPSSNHLIVLCISTLHVRIGSYSHIIRKVNQVFFFSFCQTKKCDLFPNKGIHRCINNWIGKKFTPKQNRKEKWKKISSQNKK